MIEPDQTNQPESIATVARRAEQAGWDIEWRTLEDSGSFLIISIPNGRNKRRLSVGQARAVRLLSTPFERFRVLGDYLAINNSSESYIEALIRPVGRTFARISLRDLPGVEVVETEASARTSGESQDPMDGGEDSSEPATEASAIKPEDQWRLRIAHDRNPWCVEFSDMSDAFIALVSDVGTRMALRDRRRLPTLKIREVEAARHDEALRRLEEIGGAILFELDLRYGILYELTRYVQRRPTRFRRPGSTTQPPSFPRFRYPPEALSLYDYGRSALGMPLLQFLAYYQVLEFFFPQHSRQNVLRRLRHELSDPRFDIADDSHLARILNLTSSSGRGYGTEREQLKATLNACTDESTLRDFLEEDPERLRVLGDKKRIRGVPLIDPSNRSASLLDQTAGRIYALRCRIVHTKAESGDTFPDLLLPGGAEAAALATDVEILQFLAQKAIIASGSILS